MFVLPSFMEYGGGVLNTEIEELVLSGDGGVAGSAARISASGGT